MIDRLQEFIKNFSKNYSDERTNVFKIEIQSHQQDQVSLGGRVLESSQLDLLSGQISSQFGGLRVDAHEVNILRKPGNVVMSVDTNLTSLHTSTSFISEMSSQLVFGEKLEILEETGNWVFTRQEDGYLGWTYKPYLSANLPAGANHIVLAPSVAVLAEPMNGAALLTRIFCGTHVELLSTQGGWAQIQAHKVGWIKQKDLRALSEFPSTYAARRNMIKRDTQRMIGVPYLWGGSAGNGIDCSGFARLAHRWIGIEIPRDADMQSAQCQRVEAPYRAGDLFFFGEGEGKRRITHVGICMGGWKVLHSSRSRNGVYLDDLQEKEFLRNIFVHAGSFLPGR
jgi:hypothetical protein